MCVFHFDTGKGMSQVTQNTQFILKGLIKICVYFSDGTARGGEAPGEADFTRSTGELQFKHGETSKYITIDCNKDTKVIGC